MTDTHTAMTEAIGSLEQGLTALQQSLGILTARMPASTSDDAPVDGLDLLRGAIAQHEHELGVLRQAELLIARTAAAIATPPPVVAEVPAASNGHAADALEGVPTSRLNSARFLDLFDRRRVVLLTDAARTAGLEPGHTGIAMHLRHGYLKRKGAGFVRTAKPYRVVR